MNDLIRDLNEAVGSSKILSNKSDIQAFLSNFYNEQRECPVVVRPTSEADISGLIQVARKHQRPVYPLSTGKNYGLGCQLPVTNGCILIDLSRMNKIINFDDRSGVIHIQPGVTQQQVADHLKEKQSPFVLDVTGSTAHSSILGNALERGITHYGCRVSEVLGLNVVLGTGKAISTGCYSHDQGNSLCYRYPVGADLQDLFFQSAFGVVTSTALRLKRKMGPIVSLHIAQPHSEPRVSFVDAFRRVRDAGLLPGNLHISNTHRRSSVAVPLLAKYLGISLKEAKRKIQQTAHSGYNASISFNEHPTLVEHKVQLLQEALPSNYEVVRVSENDFDAPEQLSDLQMATRGTFFHACGIPSDDSIYSVGCEHKDLFERSLEESNSGLLFLAPVLPFSGNHVVNVERIVTGHFAKHGFIPYITFNMVDDLSFEAVINLVFEKSDSEQIQRAHRAVTDAFKDLLQEKYPPHRMSIFQMSHYDQFSPEQAETMKRLKVAFDPDGIISPGRYQFESEKS